MTISTETPPVAGPGLIGALAGIAKGTYTQIVSITAPTSAVAGSLVSVVARVKNLASYAIYIAATGRYDGKDFAFKPEYANVGAGVTTSFTHSFVMPAKDVRVDVWSFYWTGTDWVQDDQAYVNIAVEIPLAGTIIRKELEYAGDMFDIPARDVPLDMKTRVHIWGRNDTSQNQKLGLGWNIRAPDGKIVEEGYDWESGIPGYTGPGGQHHFEIPQGVLDYLYLNKAGTYTIGIGLSMNPADPTLVDSYAGNLCTVVAPVVTGKIEDPRVKYNLSYKPIPIDEMPFGENFRIAFYGRNTSDINLTLGADIKIYDPDGRQVFYEEDWESGIPGYTGPGGTHNFKWPKAPWATIPVNKFGIWKARMRLYCDIGEPAAKLLDDITEKIFTVPKYAGRITDKKVDWTFLPGGEVDFPMTEPMPFGEKIRVSFLGWNDSTTTMRLRGEVWIYDPDKELFYHAEDLTTLPYSPGTAHKFIFPKPPLSTDKLEKAGDWTIRIELTDSSGEYPLAEYEGPLFTVVAPAPPVFEGTIVKKELEYDGKQVAIPMADIPVGLHGLIHIWGRNDTSENQKLGLSWIVRDPDGLVIEQDSDWEGFEILPEWLPGGYTGPGGQHHFKIPPGVLDYVDFDKVGTYTMRIELMMNPDSPVVVESYDGDLGTVTTEVPPEYELIQHTIYPHAYFYDGTAEVAIAHFTLPPEEFPWTEALGKKIADSMASKLEEEAPESRLLELKLYCDKAGPLWSKWRIEVSASVPSEGVGAIGWIIPWPLVIKGALIIAVLVLVFFIIKAVTSVFIKHKPLSEEVKKQWSKETLIGTITDLRPEYSPEALEEMPEQELRDVLNEVYEEEVEPAGAPWLKWAVIGGLGIAGGAVAISVIRLLKPKR